MGSADPTDEDAIAHPSAALTGTTGIALSRPTV
jgi:hypothetical protein